MISKHLVANSFYHTCRYISDKPGAELLVAEGVRGYDVKLMAEDFAIQQSLRPEKKRACMHAILSFYPGEILSDEKMKTIAQEYLDKLAVTNTQYVISKHSDKAHIHLHIVANMVSNDGKAIKDSWIGLRGKKIAQELTLKHQLVQAGEKNLKLTHLESLNEYEAARYKIYMSIAELLPKSKSMEELETRLKTRGIETEFKYKGHTKEKQGISFKMGEYSFKGSKIDRKFSYLSLEKTLVLQQKQILQHTKTESKHKPIDKIETAYQKENKLQDKQTGISIAKEVDKAVSDTWKALTDPERAEGSLPKELLEEQRKKKQRKPNHGLEL
ncbi:hypothetical protein DC498_22045 [Terrimonas sp.]|uniref:relaxase/mobilization nuclease domain-containing protein n=1 Tax=Terrimonas sp. TaxID=1914338 RepID=UPI000D51E630|nr:relaxase/mobilization nuclease domain-containing protein [Terrimonas sp.]PVD50006.1 hypothetical protein DC498_22045 [Terrimonas sp.]